jgi:uncharacterized membrane protein
VKCGMKSLSQAKTLGGIGSILILLSIVPYAGIIFSVIGFILVLVAVNDISDALYDKSIFNNMIIAVILSITGIVAGFVIMLASLFPFFRKISPPFDSSTFIYPRIYGLFVNLAFTLLIVWIFFIASALFLRKSYNTIASKLNIDMFEKSALVFLIGSALTIIIVGLMVIFVAAILQTVAFFSMPDEISPSS